MVLQQIIKFFELAWNFPHIQDLNENLSFQSLESYENFTVQSYVKVLSGTVFYNYITTCL
jgi:hypothetical protein